MTRAAQVVWVATLGVMAFVAVGCIYGRVAFSPDGKRFAAVIYGAEPAADDDESNKSEDSPMELWVTDLATREHTLVASAKVVGVSPAWSADGNTLWFLQGPKDEQLVLARWDGATVTTVAPVPLDGDASCVITWNPQPTPDGRAVIYTDAHDPETGETDEKFACVKRWDIAGAKATVLAEHAAGAALSPDGDWIAFLTWPPDAEDFEPVSLCVARADGSGERRTIATLADDFNDIALSPIVWSRDGSQLAWTDIPDADSGEHSSAIYVADVEAPSTARRVSLADETSFFPLWNANGSALLFAAEGAGDRLPSLRIAWLEDGTVTAPEFGTECIPAGLSADDSTLALRRCFADQDGKVAQQSVVRIVDTETEEYWDDWINIAQYQALVTSELHAAEHLTGDMMHAVDRVDAALAGLREQFPDADVDDAVGRLAALRRATQTEEQENPMQVHYLEIVTPDVDAVCTTYAAQHDVTFGEPVAVLGNARTAALANGGLVGVRAPMADSEQPVVRTYLLVDDIEAAVAAAVESGAEVAHPPLELPGYGTFAITIQGGVQHGLWQR